MPSVTLRNATDTWSNNVQPGRNYNTAKKLGIESGQRWAYVFFNRAAPLGATITNATLRVYYARDVAGSHTFTVQRIDKAWKASRLDDKNRPGVTGTAISATASAGNAGSYVEFNVTTLLQQVSDGAPWYGVRIATNHTATQWLGSAQGRADRRPSLTVSWTEAPDQPTTLRPSGNAAVALAKPTLRFDYTDHLGDTSLGAVQVQIDPAANWTTPAWDSGTVAATVPELDLAATTYAGLANGASTYWRVRVRDGAGLWSPWSEDEQFKRQDLGTVTITNPATESPQVYDSTPPFLWTTSFVQSAYQVLVVDGTKIVNDSGKRLGATQEYTPPAGVLKLLGHTYRLVVRAWDTHDREVTPGDPGYSTAWRNFTVEPDPGVPSAEGLTVTQPKDDRPGVVLRWSRATAPDKFVVRRNGTVIEDDLLLEDALIPGTTDYTFTDNTARSWRVHTWTVQAVVNGRASPATPVSMTPTVRGIWLLDKGRNLTVWLAGREGGTWERGEEASVFAPVGAEHVVRRVQSQRGYEGSLSGALVTRQDLTADQSEANLMAMRDQPARSVTLVVADTVLPVWIGNVNVYPTPEGIPPQRVASFSFWEAPA